MKLRAAALAALALTAAGCGGGQEGSELDRWRAAADAACDRAERAIVGGGQPRDVNRVMVHAGDYVLGAVDEIRALEVDGAVLRERRRDRREEARRH